MIVFKYLPMAGLIMAFKENPNMLRAGNPVQAILDADWVGLSNFRTMFSEPEIFQAIKNTLEISLLQIVIVFPIPLLLPF